MVAGVDDLAINLVGSAMFEGLKRPIAAARAFGNRRQEIIRAYEGLSSKTEVATTSRLNGAMDDLIRVLGSNYGVFNTVVDRFLVELKTSALPATMYGLLLCGRSTNDVYPAFESLYTTFSPLPFSCEDIFKSYTAAIKERIDQASNDPALVDVIRSTTDDLRNQIALVAACLKQTATSDPLSSQEFLDTRNRIAKSIEIAHRDLPVETERGTRRVVINKLVIPARLNATTAQALTSDSPRMHSDSVSLADFRRTLHRAVILGDPGGGKSTLTQLTCYEMSRRLGLDVLKSQRHIEDRDLRLPLKIVVRTLDRMRRNMAGYTILDYLRDELRPAVDNDGELTEKFLKQVLNTGKAVLLFDGLDEILEVGRRREMTAIIEQFIHSYAACPALITSRIVGYNEAPLSDEFELFVLSRLSPPEIQKYAEKLIKAIGKKEVSPKALSLDFIKQTDSNASDLRENPLLLGLMVYIFMERGDVPDNRPAIYQACSQLLFLKWDQRRDILFDYPDDFELMDLFGYIAVKMFGDTEAEDGVHRDWLLRQTRDFFEEWYSDKAKASQAAKSLVDFITGRAWVMCDVGPLVYKFTHRTFMEYFVARRLESEADSISALLQQLYPRIIKAEWDVVTHLALQISAGNGPSAARAVDGLQSLLSGSTRAPNEELNLLRFSARALEYLPVSESRYESIVRLLMDRAAEIGSRTSPSSSNVFSILLAGSKRKRQFYVGLLCDHIKNELQSSDRNRVRFARFIIATGCRPRSRYHLGATSLTPETIALAEALQTIRDADKPKLAQEASKSIDMARVYLMTHSENLSDLWDVHGSSLLIFGTDQLAPIDYNQLRFSVVEAAISGIGTRTKGQEELSLARKIAQAAGETGLPVVQPLARTDLAVRQSLDAFEMLFRVIYQSYRSVLRTTKASDAWRACFAALLTLLEIESDHFPDIKSARYSNVGRVGSKKEPRYERAGLLARFLPPDLFFEMVQFADREREQKMFETWADNKRSFLRL